MSADAYFVYLDIRLKDYLGARYHLGAAYIRAFLAEHGIASQQYLAPPTRSLDAVADELAAASPLFVGFTVFDRNFHLVRLLAEKVRSRLPDALLVAGGPTATFSYELLLERCPAIDLCVLHHGEEPCLALLQPLLARRPRELGAIPQLAISTPRGVALTGPRRMSLGVSRDGALDRFPSPYLSGSIPLAFGCQVGIVTARGCPFHCSYCNFSAMSTRVVEYHSLERTVQELTALDRSLAGRGSRARLEILDDVFTVNRQRTLAWCEAVEAAGLRHLGFWCETRADLVDEEVLEHLARAGVEEMNFGLESTAPDVLVAIHKLRGGGVGRHAAFLQDVERAVRAARAVGIAPFVSLIFGLPMETAEVAHQTLDFIESLPLEGYSHNFLHVEPGTELWQTHSQYGIAVREGPQILPHRTTHAYDVYREVPVRRHRMSLERMTRSAHALRLAERLSGAVPSRAPGDPLVFACLSGALGPVDLQAGWWASALGPATAAALVVEHLEPEEYDGWLSTAARLGLPLFRLDVARREGGAWVLADDRPALLADPEYRLRPFLPDDDDRDSDRERAVLAFGQLATGNAPERAADWIMARAEEGAASLGEVTLELSCRWSTRPCPAATHAAAWIDELGVRPCPPAPPRPPRALKELAAYQAAAHAAEVLRRGCAACEVRETCPQCLHTAPLDPAEYCRLQRRGRMQEGALLLELARLLGRSRPEDAFLEGGLHIERVIARATRLTAACRTTTTLVLAQSGPAWILYTPEDARLWELPEALGLFLEMAGRQDLGMVPHLESLCGHLQGLGVACREAATLDRQVSVPSS